MEHAVSAFLLSLLFGACIAGIYVAIDKGGLLEFWGAYLDKLAVKGKWYSKLAAPLGLCIWCMGFWLAGLLLLAAWGLGCPCQHWFWAVVPLASPTFAALFEKHSK